MGQKNPRQSDKSQKSNPGSVPVTPDKKLGAMLVTQSDIPAHMEEDYHAWYDQEHIPERLVLPGFLGASRYEVIGTGVRFFARYHLEDLSTLEQSVYLQMIKEPSEWTNRIAGALTTMTRYVTRVDSIHSGTSPPREPESCPYLCYVTYSVPDEQQSLFDSWYIEEHVSQLFTDKDWWRCIHLKVVSGKPDPLTNIIIHEVATLDSIQSSELSNSREYRSSEDTQRKPWLETEVATTYRKIVRF